VGTGGQQKGSLAELGILHRELQGKGHNRRQRNRAYEASRGWDRTCHQDEADRFARSILRKKNEKDDVWERWGATGGPERGGDRTLWLLLRGGRDTTRRDQNLRTVRSVLAKKRTLDYYAWQEKGSGGGVGAGDRSFKEEKGSRKCGTDSLFLRFGWDAGERQNFSAGKGSEKGTSTSVAGKSGDRERRLLLAKGEAVRSVPTRLMGVVDWFLKTKEWEVVYIKEKGQKGEKGLAFRPMVGEGDTPSV